MNEYPNLDFDGVVNILNGLACWGLRIAWSLIIIFIIVAGIRYMASGGSSEKTSEAKKAFAGVLIGALVILGFNVILVSVKAAVGGNEPGDKPLIPFNCS